MSITSNNVNNSFDIVIPTYNRAAFVEKAINSVKKQLYTEWNLYILDNASTDNTKEFVREFLCRNIHYVSNNSNIGMVRNWMKGILETGNAAYVVLLSDDDELEENFLLKANEGINRYPGVGLYSSAVNVKNNITTTVWMSEYVNHGNKEYDISLPAHNLHYFLGGNPVSPAAMVIRRESFRLIRDYNLSNSKVWSFDRYWWAQIALVNTVVFYSLPTAIYHQHQQSESANISKNNFDKTTESFRVTANILNMALNLELITIESLDPEIKKLWAPAQLDVLCSLVLYGRKDLYDYAIQYFKSNIDFLFKNYSFLKRNTYSLLGLKLFSYIRMYRSRT